MLPIRPGMSAIAALALTTAALAGPRESFHPLSVDSIALVNSASNQKRTLNLSGGYQIKRIDFSGTLQIMINGAKPVDSMVRITPPPGQGGSVTFSIVGGISPQIPGSTHDGLGSVPVPAGWVANGAFTVEFYQNTDNGAGADAHWIIANFTFNDSVEPPVNNGPDNLGEISRGTVTKTVNIGANGVHWFRFSVPQAIGAIGYNYAFDIDTLGSNLAPFNDTVLALYNDRGNPIAINDDDLSTNLSLLSFGVGYRTPPTLVTPTSKGWSGSLDAGTYYLAVFAFGVDTIAHDYNVVSTSANTGPVTVNFRTSIPNPSGALCPVDFNASGSVNVADIFDFLTAWFHGCP